MPFENLNIFAKANFLRNKNGVNACFWGTAYLPFPNYNYFLLWAKCSVWGGVGEQFPRNTIWSQKMHSFLLLHHVYTVCFGSLFAEKGTILRKLWSFHIKMESFRSAFLWGIYIAVLVRVGFEQFYNSLFGTEMGGFWCRIDYHSVGYFSVL